MNLATQRTRLETGFMTGMLLLYPGLVMLGENADTDPVEESKWLRMSITVLDTSKPCIGNDHEETEAIFNVQIFTRLGIGAAEVSALADAARSVLSNGSYENISFLSFDISTGSVEADWFSLILRASYRAQA